MSLTLRSLSDDDLIRKIAALARAEREVTATLIAHLAELEARNLHLAQGFRSLFGYCRHVLHCSEHEAYNRMEVVHAARRFPVILPMLAEGSLHLTAVRLLAPHLRDEDHLALLGEAVHKSRREVVAMLARWFPTADVPSTVRKLPPPTATPVAPGPLPPAPAPEGRFAATTVPAPAPSGPPAVVAPLSAERYKLQITMDAGAHADLRCLQDLMRREVPDGDPAVIVGRALALLRREIEKKAFAAMSAPRESRGVKPGSRHISAAVERAVWQRDQGQCAFEGARARCPERSFLEFHHVTPWAAGGAPSVENIALRCRAHNAYEADVYFGPIRAAMGERPTAPAP